LGACLQWRDVKEQYDAAGVCNFISASDCILPPGGTCLAPLNTLHNFNYVIITKHRSRS